ncbi:putative WD repeat-containing protein C17D11.16 [Sesamum angolense]|uniref:WD repeat-containing protein C17D11.16 n=1 Tax=Sesamum angolense TaxID=2727404 RepID=A0AAE1XA10_9LAMI|nr:putative WD repeat-containing protein C17D11.16 [Sesamum angolense]
MLAVEYVQVLLSRMIAAVSWVPKGASKSVPIAAEPPSKEEIEEILKSGVLEINEGTENEENSEDMNVDALKQDDELARALSAADALGKTSKSSMAETDRLTDTLRELDMDRYDEEDDGVELFGSGLANLYYPSNDMDPYLKNQEDDSEEEEDITIKPEDAVIVCARNEDDVSHLEACLDIGNPTDGDSNMYVHHDIVIPAFPLCTAWLDCPLKGGERGDISLSIGNFIAVGSMEPAIEIWILILYMDEVQPSATLGGIIEKKKKGKKKSVKYKDGSHTDSVLGLAWNKEYRNILASASADKLVKIWDVATETCFHADCMDTHLTLKRCNKPLNNVQAVAWNHFAPQVLLSGSFDHSVVMKDGRLPSHSGFKWSVAADVESLAWDPHTEHSFVVSLENGMVTGFDIRTASSDLSSPPKPSFTLHAHDKAVSTIAYNSSVPNLLATGSMDKMVKLWDLSNQPSCIASKNPKAGQFPWLLAFPELCFPFPSRRLPFYSSNWRLQGKIAGRIIGQEIDMCAEISMAARMLESLPVLRYLVRRVLSCLTVKRKVMLNG